MSAVQHPANGASTAAAAAALSASAASSVPMSIDAAGASGSSAATAAAAATPFPFPFPPYPQQYALMSHLLSTIERGRGHVAVIESPTGTGKSLSLISSCLYWLLEHHPAQVRALEFAASASIQSVGTGRLLPDWVGVQTAAKAAAVRAEKAAKEGAIRDVVAQQSRMLEQRAAALDKRVAAATTQGEDEEFLLDSGLDAYTGRAPQLSPAQELRIASLLEQQESEAELLHAADTPMQQKIRLIYARVDRSAEIKRLSLGQQAEDEVGDLLAKLLRPDKPRRRPQIIYASRTHSQLVQMVGEIGKLKYGRNQQEEQRRKRAAATPPTTNWQATTAASSSIATPSPSSATSSSAPLTLHQLANSFDPLLQAKVISLGSRSNLCIRPEFAHLRKGEHGMRLNDACLDLQKKKAAAKGASASKTANGCEYLNADALPIFHDHVLAQIHDLEQLVVKGEQLHCCPYYGSRNASPEADVLIVPYASLLSAHTRASLQIELDDAIIIIDEAHNLHDTINEIHSCRLTFKQLRDSRNALKKYLEKFQQRLAPVNKLNVELLIRVCEAFLLALQYSHTEAHRQSKEEAERGSAFAAHRGGEANRDLTDIFSDGAKDGIHLREAALKRIKQAAGTNGAPRPASVVDSLLSQAATTRPSQSRCSYSLIKSITHFNASLGIADVNYHHVESWMERSDLCKKIKGYIEKGQAQEREAADRMQQRFGAKGAAAGTFERAVVDAPYESTSISPLTPVMEFIKALSNIEGDGRVCIDVRVDGVAAQVHPDTSLRFLMLNPSVHLLPLLKSARTIILAGGTMQPFDAFKYQLFPVLAAHEATPPVSVSTDAMAKATVMTPLAPSTASDSVERLHFFSCSHVIPPSHIQALILKSGPGLAKSRPFNFQASMRGDHERLDDLAATLINLINVIPQGVVVFFTSYAFAAQVLEYWSTHASKDRRVYENERVAAVAGAKAAACRMPSLSGAAAPPATWLERIRRKKVVFRDAQGQSFEETLDAYTRIIRQCDATPVAESSSPAAGPVATIPGSPSSFTDATLQSGQTGAILFSVVGGKMSEGINFTDGLARGVVMVGLPYPNARDPLMKEKTAYAEREMSKRADANRASVGVALAPPSPSLSGAGHQLLNTLCMRAVNQSIGRAIRHARDFASIILLDERYLRADVEALLPRWIKTNSFEPAGVDFVTGFKAIGSFFQSKRAAAAASPAPSIGPATLPLKRKATEPLPTERIAPAR